MPPCWFWQQLPQQAGILHGPACTPCWAGSWRVSHPQQNWLFGEDGQNQSLYAIIWRSYDLLEVAFKHLNKAKLSTDTVESFFFFNRFCIALFQPPKINKNLGNLVCRMCEYQSQIINQGLLLDKHKPCSAQSNSNDLCMVINCPLDTQAVKNSSQLSQLITSALTVYQQKPKEVLSRPLYHPCIFLILLITR